MLVQVMDHGYPQFTEAKILSEFIKTDAHKMEVRMCCTCLNWLTNIRCKLPMAGVAYV